MALVFPDVGEVLSLARFLYASGVENFTHKLFKTSVTPAESDTAGSYTEADFTSYVAKTITNTQTGSTWPVPTTSGGVTSSTYATASNWLPTSSQTVYGHFIIGASTSTLYAAEAFAAGKALVSGDSLTINLKIALD